MPWQDVGLRLMLTDWVKDPVRRRNVLWRIVEGYAGGLLATAWWFPWCFVLAPVTPLVEWLLYEFVLEPLGRAGPYWERGPRDGETFTRW